MDVVKILCTSLISTPTQNEGGRQFFHKSDLFLANQSLIIGPKKDRNMSLTKDFFGVEINELTTELVNTFFSEPREENHLIEFKSGGVELQDVHKEISAFLNTDGGLLILGTSNPSEDKTVSGNLVGCNRIKNKQSLVQSIVSGMTPNPVPLIKIQPLPCNGIFAYIIEIISSPNPPHQVSNTGRYHVRIDEESIVATHGFIEALFRKRALPILALGIDFKFTPNSLNYPSSLTIKLQLENNAKSSAMYPGLFALIYNASPQLNFNKFDEDLSSIILVEGLSLSNEYYLGSDYSRYILIQVCYYCKDLSLSIRTCLFDTLTKSRKFHDHSHDNFLELQNIYSEFCKGNQIDAKEFASFVQKTGGSLH